MNAHISEKYIPEKYISEEFVTLLELSAQIPRLRGGGEMKDKGNTLRKYAVEHGFALFKAQGDHVLLWAMTLEEARRLIQYRGAPHVLVFGVPLRPRYYKNGVRLIPIAEMQRFFGVHYKTINQWCAVHEIPVVYPPVVRTAESCLLRAITESDALDLAALKWKEDEFAAWLRGDDLALRRFVFTADAAHRLGVPEHQLITGAEARGMPVLRPDPPHLPRLRFCDYEDLLARW